MIGKRVEQKQLNKLFSELFDPKKGLRIINVCSLCYSIKVTETSVPTIMGLSPGFNSVLFMRHYLFYQ